MTIRVLHVTTVPMTLRFLRGHAAFMAEHGIELQFVTSDGPERLAFAEQEGVVTHAVEMRRAISPAHDLVALSRLVGVVRRVAPDIVHSHTPKGGLLGTMAGRIARVPRRIYHLHGLRYASEQGWRRRLLMETERSACAMATEVISVSHSVRRSIAADGLCPFDKLRVLAHGSGGVDSGGTFDPARVPADARAELRAAHGLSEDDWVVLFVGRLAKDKGIRELLAAWEIVERRAPRARLLVVGPVEDVDPELLAAARARPQTITLVGPHRQVERAYAASDVLVLPTYREGFSTVLLEAAAMRLPRVASAVDGCTDAIDHGRSGLLVPPREAEPLAEALLRYHDHPELAAAHAEVARRDVVERFQPVEVLRELAALYRRDQGLPRK
ncbi:MAG: glycosyltransferase family 4 protein [Myxococcales bacterium]|nr:glycosyltransferase family 4 protein [Myxococcales bacterium]MCB9713333.1 glycosyltransferase family 4 protein [Myxococcales bacterium]